jgi:hypothetical protein
MAATSSNAFSSPTGSDRSTDSEAELSEEDKAVVDELISSFKQEFPKLEFDFNNGAIRVNFQGFWNAIAYKEDEKWIVSDHAKKVMENYLIFKELEAKLLAEEGGREKRGMYILVNSPIDRSLHHVESTAARRMTGLESYLGRVGFDWRTDSQILALGANHKPPGFGDFEQRFLLFSSCFTFFFFLNFFSTILF